MSSDRTPADVVREANDQWDTDMTQHIVAAEPHPGPVQDYVLRALAAAGFRVVPEPDDTTRRHVIADTLQAWHDEWNGEQFTYVGLADMILSALSGDREERPAQCPTCGSDDPAMCNTDGELHEFGDVDTGCCPDSWHGVGVSR